MHKAILIIILGIIVATLNVQPLLAYENPRANLKRKADLAHGSYNLLHDGWKGMCVHIINGSPKPLGINSCCSSNHL